jgi:hypothetical protein
VRDDNSVLAYWSWAKLDPHNIEVYRGFGEFFDSLGHRADALLAWSTMSQVRPREAEGYRAYSQKLVQTGASDKATAAYRQAVKYRPIEFEITQELSVVFQKLNESGKIPQLGVFALSQIKSIASWSASSASAVFRRIWKARL